MSASVIASACRRGAGPARPGTRPPMWRSGAALAACAMLALPGADPAAAQDRWSSALVPADHWVVDALHRLAGLGLVPVGHDVSRRIPTQAEAGSILEAAASVDSPHRTQAEAWLDRVGDEFGRDGAPGHRLPGDAAHIS